MKRMKKQEECRLLSLQKVEDVTLADFEEYKRVKTVNLHPILRYWPGFLLTFIFVTVPVWLVAIAGPAGFSGLISTIGGGLMFGYPTIWWAKTTYQEDIDYVKAHKAIKKANAFDRLDALMKEFEESGRMEECKKEKARSWIQNSSECVETSISKLQEMSEAAMAKEEFRKTIIQKMLKDLQDGKSADEVLHGADMKMFQNQKEHINDIVKDYLKTL